MLELIQPPAASGPNPAACEFSLKLRPIPAADRDGRTVMEKGLVFARLQRAHAREVDNCGSVNAAKHIRIEVRFQFRHTTSQQMRFRPDVQTGIIIRGLDPIDVGGLEE